MKRIALAAVFVVLGLSPGLADQKLDEAVKKADEQFQKGKPDEAVNTLKKLVSQTPTTEALIALGRMQERAGSIDEAGDSYTKAVAAAASAPPATQAGAYAALAASDLRRGLGKDAMAHAQAAVKAQSNGTSLGILARVQAHEGDGPAALKTGDSAVQAEPGNAAAHVGRGAALLALHRYEDAAQAFQKALAIDPKMVAALVGAALADAQSHSPDTLKRGVDEAQKATDIDQKSGEAFGALGVAKLAANPKNWDDAIGQAQQGATVLDPKDPEIQVEVGRILEARGNLDQAVASYQRAVAADPTYLPAREALVRAEYMSGKSDQAIAHAQALIKDFPTSGETAILLGRMLLQKKNYMDAQAALEKGVPLAPTAEAHALLGTADQFTYRSAEALEHYKEAVRLDPTNLDYQTTYGLLLGVNKQHDEGIEVLKKVVQNPGYKGLGSAYSNLGWLYRNAEPRRTTEAIAAYKKALELDPKSVQAALGLGWSYTYAKEWESALASFQTAVGLDPTTRGEAYDGLAWCYLFTKDLEKAKAALQKAADEGHSDAALKASIERVERAASDAERARVLQQTEGPKAQPEGPNLEDLWAKLRKGSPGQKIAAATEMGKLRDTQQFLCFSLETDPIYEVRVADVNALGSVGGAQAKSCLVKVLNNPPPAASINPTPQDVADQAHDADLKRLIKEVLARLH
jgi:tetratricopeptide (TPR) repeat protein